MIDVIDVVVDLDEKKMHPLLAYLGYEKYSIDTVTSHDPEGIEEEARCAAFSITPPGVVEDDMESGNDTSDQDWFPPPPHIIPYKIDSTAVLAYDPTVPNSNAIHTYSTLAKLMKKISLPTEMVLKTEN